VRQYGSRWGSIVRQYGRRRIYQKEQGRIIKELET